MAVEIPVKSWFQISKRAARRGWVRLKVGETGDESQSAHALKACAGGERDGETNAPWLFGLERWADRIECRDASFPLTPALSPAEREQRSPSCSESVASRPSCGLIVELSKAELKVKAFRIKYAPQRTPSPLGRGPG